MNDELNEINGINEDSNAYDAAKNEARDWAKGKSLIELAVEFKSTKLEKEALELQLKLVNAKFDVLRFEAIPNKVDEMGLESPVKIEGVGRVSLSADILMSVKGGQKPEVMKWLRSNGLGDLINEDFNSSTLKSYVKKAMVDGKAYPSDLLNITPIIRASVLK